MYYEELFQQTIIVCVVQSTPRYHNNSTYLLEKKQPPTIFFTINKKYPLVIRKINKTFLKLSLMKKFYLFIFLLACLVRGLRTIYSSLLCTLVYLCVFLYSCFLQKYLTFVHEEKKKRRVFFFYKKEEKTNQLRSHVSMFECYILLRNLILNM